MDMKLHCIMTTYNGKSPEILIFQGIPDIISIPLLPGEKQYVFSENYGFAKQSNNLPYIYTILSYYVK